MIEVNLLPGGKKQRSRRGRLSLPKLSLKGGGGGGSPDRMFLGSLALILLAVGGVGYLYTSTNARSEEVTLAIQDAQRDSARYHDLIQQTEGLRARRDTIGQKVSIIQDIDGARYVWPHVMDEVGRALPAYTWLTGILQVSQGPLVFRIEGRAGNNFALTRFMENLEASPFVRDVTLITTEQVTENAEGVSSTVHAFTLDATYEEPPSELIETVPLFSASTASDLLR